jgi:hypothetical protein
MSHPKQILPQRLGGVGNVILNGFLEAFNKLINRT